MTGVKKPSEVFAIESRYGHRITLNLGDITNVQSDVIINFIGCKTEFNFTEASESIIKKAGKSVDIQEWLSAIRFRSDTLETHGGSLGCRRIINCIVPKCLKDDERERENLKKILETAIQNLMTANENVSREIVVAVPLSFSSSIGFPPRYVDVLVFESVVACLERIYDNHVIRKIFLVGRDDTNFDAIMQAANSLNSKPDQSQGISFPSGLKFEMRIGSIFDEKVDAMLISVNPDLDLSKGQISKQLLRIAGTDIQRECYAKRPWGLKPGDLVVTDGYNLNCRSVFHGSIGHDVDNNIEKLKFLIENALRTSCDMKLSSLALPALGTSIGIEGPVCAAVTLQAIYNFEINCFHSATLKRIVVVLHPFDKDIIQAFTDYAKALNSELRKPTWSIFPGSPSSSPGTTNNLTTSRVSKHDAKEGKGGMNRKTRQPLDGGESPQGMDDRDFGASEDDDVSRNGDTDGVWFYKENGKLLKYPEKIGSMLERNFRARKSGTLWDENGKIYKVLYSEMGEEVAGSDDVVKVVRM